MKRKAPCKGASAGTAALVVLGALLLAFDAKAQPGNEAGDLQGSSFFYTLSPEPANIRRRLRFQLLQREDGLPQSQVSSIVQGPTGFMWLGTQDGLARYDGQRFVVFRHNPEESSSLSNSFVNDLLLTKNGALWVGTEGGGVNRYEPQTSTFERFSPTADFDTLNSGSILSMSEGPEGKIWIGTQGGGLSALDPETGKVRSYSVEDGLSPVVPAVLATDDGTVWVGTSSGLYKFDPEEGVLELLFMEHDTLGSAVITALAQDQKGNLWFGTAENGLVRYSPKTKKLKRFRADPDDPRDLMDNAIRSVYEDSKGRIWVGSDQALHLLDPETGRFQRSLMDSDDPKSVSVPVLDVYEDAAGVIWVGSFSGGAALLDPRSLSFEYYKTAGVGALFFKGQDLWASSTERLCRWRRMTRGVCYPVVNATAVHVDRSGTVWVGTMGSGLLRLDPDAGDRWIGYEHNPSDPRSLSPGPVMEVYEDRSGGLWVGLLGGGLQRFNREDEEFRQDYELPSGVVYSVKEDPKQNKVLWLATGDRGLVRLNVDTGETEMFIPKPDDLENKTDNAVVDFLFDGDKTIWLATYGGGLKRLDRESGEFKTYRRDSGIPNDTLYSILEDEEGNLWLSSIAGLARFNPESEEVQVFTPADGVQSEEFTLKAATVSEDGKFAFGGIKGVNVFDPGDIEIDGYSPPVVLTSVKVLGEAYRTDRPTDSLERLSLDHDEAFVSVDFAALSFSGSDQLQFEYKVGGASADWLSSESAVVSLAGLDDGDYTLLLRARNRHGVESKTRKLAILVAPPPWRTWWAYTAYGVVFIGVLFGTYRYQQVRIDRLEKLARLATVEREFEVTAAVQSWFLPGAAKYTYGEYELAGFYRAADQCSGDWWWYEELGGNKLWVIVADVTGHGAGPAMVTAAVAMGLGVQSDQGVPKESELVDRLSRVNSEVLSRCKGKAHMTMTAAVVDLNTGSVNVQGLGGLPALRMGTDGKHKVIGPRGTPLGSGEKLEVGERGTQMEPGDRLLIMSDGIVETMLPGGRPLGMRRFVKLMREVRGVPLESAVERIVQQVDLERGNETQEDDFTFCVLERRR